MKYTDHFNFRFNFPFNQDNHDIRFAWLLSCNKDYGFDWFTSYEDNQSSYLFNNHSLAIQFWILWG